MSEEINNEKKRKSSGLHFHNQIANLSDAGIPLLLTVIITFVVMIFTCLAVFFFNVRGEEQVMVPDVTGNPLTSALLKMQEKELYPKIELRYSDIAGEEGKVIDQDPPAGSIVKAYKTIKIVVSRGLAIESVENYVGKNIDDIQTRLQTLFSGEDAVMTLGNPIYQQSEEPAGTIIAQYPAADSIIGDSETLILIVSSGAESPVTTVPSIKGLSVPRVLEEMAKSQVIFDFSSHDAAASENAGTVTSVQDVSGKVPTYTRVNAEFAFPVANPDDVEAYGIFTYKLDEYPYPVPVTLELSDLEGNVRELVHFNHPGKELSIPYKAPKGSVLTLYVLDNLVTMQTVQ